MEGEIDAFSLIRTKMQRPRLPRDLIPRRRLLDRLHTGSERKLTLITAPAGLIGVINQVNMLGLPLVSVECVSAPVENWPAMEGDH